jgi:hypothetical protein
LFPGDFRATNVDMIRILVIAHVTIIFSARAPSWFSVDYIST